MWLLPLLLACSSPESSPAPAGPSASSPAETPAGPEGPPPPGSPTPGGSGGALQDPTGFPHFHAMPAPPGPLPQPSSAWSPAQRLSEVPGGGYRPQIAIDSSQRLHVVYYLRDPAGDLIRHRYLEGERWSPPQPLGFDRDRNWGPDLISLDEGGMAVVFDRGLEDMSSQGFLTLWDGEGWSKPEALTPAGGEVGSGHIVQTEDGDLAYLYIGKALDPQARFRAWLVQQDGGVWGEPSALTDGLRDAWHTNIERRPDGSALAGWDEGTGGTETQLYVMGLVQSEAQAVEDISRSSRPGERPHFAFGADGVDHLTWFHKIQGRPVAVYTRSGRSGDWGELEQPSAGLGGFHYDPDLAIRDDGTLCIVWGWDQGEDAELLYSLQRGGRWSAPAKVAELDWGKPGLPSIEVDKEGRFHVVWSQGVRGENHVYYALLDDD